MAGQGAGNPARCGEIRGRDGKAVVWTELPSEQRSVRLASSLPLMECDPPLGMSSSVIHLIEFYEQGSHIGEPACLLPSAHPPLLAAWGREWEQGVHAQFHHAVDRLVSDFLPALENVQGSWTNMLFETPTASWSNVVCFCCR